MKVGITLRNMGPAAETSILAACARAADESALDSVWVMDHVAIPPDDAEGSGGLQMWTPTGSWPARPGVKSPRW